MGCCNSTPAAQNTAGIISRLKDAIQLKEIDVALELARQIKPGEHDNKAIVGGPGSEFTPLCLACYIEGDPSVVVALLENGCDPNLTIHSKKWTPLQLAARFNKPEAAVALLKHGADISLVNEQGKSLLLILTCIAFSVCENFISFFR